MTRSHLLHVAAAAVAILAAPASAQAYPTRPIQVIVPFAGGSASDVVMRILLDRMAKSIGQPFIVDNRPGAGGNIGTSAATKAAPDGYTLVMGSTGPMAANRTLYRDLGYDPDKDLEPISLFAYFPILIVVSSKLPVKSLNEFVTYAKSRPKQLNYGSVGIGSSQHLSGVYFEQVAGLELTHVPYRNIAQYVPDLIAGTVPVGFQWLPNVSAPLQSGDARALAVAASKRTTALPDVPTAAEAGMRNYEASGSRRSRIRRSPPRSSSRARKGLRRRPRGSPSSSVPKPSNGARSSSKPASLRFSSDLRNSGMSRE